jgi:hypothetical protein
MAPTPNLNVSKQISKEYKGLRTERCFTSPILQVWLSSAFWTKNPTKIQYKKTVKKFKPSVFVQPFSAKQV